MNPSGFNGTRIPSLELTLTGLGVDASYDRGVRRSRGNVLPSEFGKEASVTAAERPRAPVSVHLARTTKSAAAGLGGARRGGSEQLALHGHIVDIRNVLEDVTLGENVTARTNLEGMATVIVPVVVNLRYHEYIDLGESTE